VASCDGRIRFKSNFSLKFQTAKSWYGEPDDISIFPGDSGIKFCNYTSKFDGEKFEGIAYYGKFSYSSKLLNSMIKYTGISPTFRADNGFIKRNDFKKIESRTTLNFWINKGIFERISPGFKYRQECDYTGRFAGNYISPTLSMVFKGQTSLYFSHSISSEKFKEVKFENMQGYSLYIHTNFSKFFSLGVSYSQGEEIIYGASLPSLGRFTTIGICGSTHPFPKLYIEFSPTRYRLWGKEGSQLYDLTIIESKINYQFTKYLGIRFITQYHSLKKSGKFFPLFSFEPNAFTIFYLGGNHSFGEETNGTNPSLFLKLRYLF
jgi:hypothetical protein